MYTIKGLDFVQTCFACPEQYDVFSNGEQVCYVRLRWGSLYAECPDVGGTTVYEADIGDGTAGIFESEDQRQYHLMQIAKAVKKWLEDRDESEEEEDEEDAAMNLDVLSVIDYISNRIDENPYEGSWITDRGERVSADVGYVIDWWRDCMKPELLRKFG